MPHAKEAGKRKERDLKMQLARTTQQCNQRHGQLHSTEILSVLTERSFFDTDDTLAIVRDA